MTKTRLSGSTTIAPATYVYDTLTGTLKHTEIATLPTAIQAQIAAAKAVFLGHNYVNNDGWLHKGVVATVKSLLDVNESRARSIAAELTRQGLTQGNGAKGNKRRTKIVLSEVLVGTLADVRGMLPKAEVSGNGAVPRPQHRNPVPSLDDLRGNGQGGLGGTITIGIADSAFGGPVSRQAPQLNGLARQLAHLVADQVVLATNGDPDLVAAVVRDLAGRGFPV